MSVIAIKVTDKQIVIGSDTQVTHYGVFKSNDDDAKLLQFDDLIIGSAGSCKVFNLLPIFLETNKLKSNSDSDIIRFFKNYESWLKKETNVDSIHGNNFLIVKDKKAFEFSNYYLREITDYWAIGSGLPWALAILALDMTVEKALEASCKLDLYCSKPIKIIEIDK
jgi:ATP-dependent protease HslVU (ClpYQ) peptidase subunit